MKKNVLERALKTFVEAFIPTMVAALAGADFTDLEALPRVLVAIAISAAATGISAVWNGIVDPWLKKGMNDPDDEAGTVEQDNS